MDAVEHVTGHPLGHVADAIPVDVRQYGEVQASPTRSLRQLHKAPVADDTMIKTITSIIRIIDPRESKQVGCSLIDACLLTELV